MKPMTLPVLTIAELDNLVPDLLFIEAWAAAVKVEIQRALEAGAEMDHATLEPKRGMRKWDAEEPIVMSTLRDVLQLLNRDPNPDVYAPRKVVTPAGAEKLIGKRYYDQHLSTLVTSESSGYNLKLR